MIIITQREFKKDVRKWLEICIKLYVLMIVKVFDGLC